MTTQADLALVVLALHSAPLPFHGILEATGLSFDQVDAALDLGEATGVLIEEEGLWNTDPLARKEVVL